MLFATMFFQSGIKWVPDEICTLIQDSTSPIVNKINDLLYFFAVIVPLIVGFINFCMIKRLNVHASNLSCLNSKQNENKTIFINLIIQTFQPLLGQWPSIIFYYYLQSRRWSVNTNKRSPYFTIKVAASTKISLSEYVGSTWYR
uniref:G-protein coupled receptors family 1 profile domain-containing protein n=1 Tax=Strongyloides venezuelensis TaxID=75913 RepID=A0A0K0EZJ2_STRVS